MTSMVEASQKPNAGDLVVIPSRPNRGVGRLERWLPPLCDADAHGHHSEDRGRVFFYRDGSFGVFTREEIVSAPPGVWPSNASSGGS